MVALRPGAARQPPGGALKTSPSWAALARGRGPFALRLPFAATRLVRHSPKGDGGPRSRRAGSKTRRREEEVHVAAVVGRRRCARICRPTSCGPPESTAVPGSRKRAAARRPAPAATRSRPRPRSRSRSRSRRARRPAPEEEEARGRGSRSHGCRAGGVRSPRPGSPFRARGGKPRRARRARRTTGGRKHRRPGPAVLLGRVTPRWPVPSPSCARRSSSLPGAA